MFIYQRSYWPETDTKAIFVMRGLGIDVNVVATSDDGISEPRFKEGDVFPLREYDWNAQIIWVGFPDYDDIFNADNDLFQLVYPEWWERDNPDTWVTKNTYVKLNNYRRYFEDLV